MDKPRQAKVLIYDIETAPIIGTVWGKYEQNLVWEIQDWYMLCFAYKWLGEKKTYVVAQDDFKGYKPGSEDDSKVVKKLHELFLECDTRVAHHGDYFDEKKSNARFILNGLDPVPKVKTIDTKKIAKSRFMFTSNKLDDLGTMFGLGNKVETGGASLWKGCMAGDPKAWAKMKRYNKQDVDLLEKVYLKLRPWMENHPPVGIIQGTAGACDVCGGTEWRATPYKAHSKTGFKYRYQCMATDRLKKSGICGAYKLGAMNRVEDKTNRLQ